METKKNDNQKVLASLVSGTEINNWNFVLNGPPEEDEMEFEDDDLDDLEDDEFPIEEDLDGLDYDEEDLDI